MKVQAAAKDKKPESLVCKEGETLLTPEAIERRLKRFTELFAKQTELLKARPKHPITVTLPDGKTVPAVAFETTPYDIAMKISKRLAEKCIVAKVKYSKRDAPFFGASVDVDEVSEAVAADEKENIVDLSLPLEGDCSLTLVTADDPVAKRTIYHSSAHFLGRALERAYHAFLCHGPPIESGFFYDAFTGNHAVSANDYHKIEELAQEVIASNSAFQRLQLSKADALDLFKDNPFKQILIKEKVADNAITSAYRCGDFVDLCTGPHIPHTGIVKAFKVTKNSASYWKGKQENDDLQRLYGVSFLTHKELTEHMRREEELKQRDHRTLGEKQKLFIFNELSPGACFFLPHGTRIFNKLVNFIRKQYHVRGFTEVNTPNMFKNTLYKISGHYFKYKENIFFLEIENQEFGLKPMNCPSHCIMFDSDIRSYRDLPIRYADFGVLHRNEVSGALSGLTRVRKFHQDDAHIFITEDQIESEICDQLNFLRYVYGVIGFEYSFELSTRPEKYLGEIETWDKAEAALKNVLDKTCDKWKLNPGDGAYYGPKIDIKITDCYKRPHQLGTIQLDFVQPMRFNLQYRDSKEDEEVSGEEEEHEEKKEKKPKKEKAKEKPQGDTIKEEKTEDSKAKKPKEEKEKKPKEEKDKKPKEEKDNKPEAEKEKKPKQEEKEKKPEEEKDKKQEQPKAEQHSAVKPAEEHSKHHHEDHKEEHSKHHHESHKEEHRKAPKTLAEEEVYYAQPGKLKPGFKRPIIVHRAILGSLERCMAILIEHFGGKWPFWLSPRQVIVLPLSDKHNEYAKSVKNRLVLEGFDAEVDTSNAKINRKIREAQLAQYNYILVVGPKEQQNGTINIRERDCPDPKGEMPVQAFVELLHSQIPGPSEFEKRFVAESFFGNDEKSAALNRFGLNKEHIQKWEEKLGQQAFFGGESANEEDKKNASELQYVDLESLGYPNLAKWKKSLK